MDKQRLFTGIIAVFLGFVVITGFLTGAIEPKKGYSSVLPILASTVTIIMGMTDIKQGMRKK